MKLSLYVRTEASDDLADAFLFYEERQINLGYEFLDEWEVTANFISQNPFAFELRHKSFRAVPLKRFPFIVIYEAGEKQVVVYAVVHASRNPKKRFERK